MVNTVLPGGTIGSSVELLQAASLPNAALPNAALPTAALPTAALPTAALPKLPDISFNNLPSTGYGAVDASMNELFSTVLQVGFDLAAIGVTVGLFVQLIKASFNGK